jgi:Flp pilus assembly protein TadG
MSSANRPPADPAGDEGLAGVETLFIVIGVLVFASTTLFTIGRLMLTKIDLSNIASEAARSAANAASAPQATLSTDRYGDPVTLSVTMTSGACAMVNATALTTVPLISWLPAGGPNTFVVSATASSPVNVYQLVGQGGFACTGG